MTATRLVLGLALAGLVPTLALPIDWPAGLLPLAGVDRVGWFVAVSIFVASAPGGRGHWPWWSVPAAFAPLAGLVVALDGSALAAVMALVVAGLAARARALSRPTVWAVIWWMFFAAPVLLSQALGAAAGAGEELATGRGPSPELFARAFELSPFSIARAPWSGAAQDFAGAAIGAAVALLAPLVGRPVGEATTDRVAHTRGGPS